MRRNEMNEVCNFSRFVADRAFHTCAAFVGRGGIATPAFLVTFDSKSNITSINGCYQKNAKTNTFHKTIAQRFLVGLTPSLGMTWATNSRPYGVGVKYKLLWDYYCKNSSLRSE